MQHVLKQYFTHHGGHMRLTRCLHRGEELPVVVIFLEAIDFVAHRKDVACVHAAPQNVGSITAVAAFHYMKHLHRMTPL